MLTEMVKVSGTHSNFFNLGQARMASGQYAAAGDAFSTANLMKRDDFATLAGYGNANVMKGDGADAEKWYNKALAVNGANGDIHLRMAWARFQQGNMSGALQSAENAAALKPSDPGPLLFQAAMLNAGAEREALLNEVASLRKELKRELLVPMLIAYTKWLQANNGLEQSIIYLDLAVAADPKNIDYLELRYGTNKMLSRHKQADADEHTMSKL